MVPERALGGMVYTLFRPNLGVATARRAGVGRRRRRAVAVAVRPRACGTCRCRPATSTTSRSGCLRLALPRAAARRTGSRYDGRRRARLDLRYDAVMEPHTTWPPAEAFGHFDQLCRVTGTLTRRRRRARGRLPTPCATGRGTCATTCDRCGPATRTAPSTPTEHFLAFSRPAERRRRPTTAPSSAATSSATARRPPSREGHAASCRRRRGHPDEIEVDAVDADGRELVGHGPVTASLASQSTPGHVRLDEHRRLGHRRPGRPRRGPRRLVARPPRPLHRRGAT